MRPKFSILIAVLASVAAVAASPDHVSASLRGTFDNRAQLDKAGADHAMPHVTVTIERTPKEDFSLWHVHVETDSESSFDQTWAMQSRIEHDGSNALVPYYQLKQTSPPSAAAFDPQQWLSLEACALRGHFTQTRLAGASEGEQCVAVTMGVGARRALLPVGIAYEGDRLNVDLNLRGERVRVAADRVK